MVFIIRKVGRTYVVKNRWTGSVKGERSSHSKAQKLAVMLERDQGRRVSVAYSPSRRFEAEER